jgi:hypothetical protein
MAHLLRHVNDVVSRLDETVCDAMVGLIDAARDSGSNT